MRQAPVGRRSEWDSLINWLDERHSGLVLIQGDPGSGRTHLLQHLGSHAQEKGYAVAGCTEHLSLESTTQLSDVARALGALLGPPADEDDEEHGLIGSLVKAFKAGYNAEKDVYSILERVGDVLVGIDGYSPNSRLEQWVRGPLVKWMQASSGAAVVVIVDRPQRLSGIREQASLVVDLGVLDRDELRSFFASCSNRLEPPLTHEEIEAYSTAAEDPSVFHALRTVMVAASSGRGTTHGSD